MSKLPVFESKFLNQLSNELAARRKALKYHGELSWETKQPDDFEWLTVNITPIVGNYCIFQFVEDNRVCIFVRSKNRSNRGKVLLAIENINVVDNAQEIMAAIMVTIKESNNLQSASTHEATRKIRDAWSRVKICVRKGLD